MVTRICNLKRLATLSLVLFMACMLPEFVHAGFSSGAISGICYLDANNNGVYDPDELGIQGVKISLKKISISAFGAVYSKTAMSDGSGFFEFNALSPALYMLEVTTTDTRVCTTPAKKILLVSPLKKELSLMFGFAGPAIPPHQRQKPTIEIEAMPSTVLLGDAATLAWQTSNAAIVVITPGIGKVATSGSIAVAPLKTTTYTFIVIGPKGIIIGKTTVKVISSPVPPDQCQEDNDCPAGYECANGQCQKIDVPEPECVADNDCPAGYECANGQCQKIDVPEPECVVDNDCPAGYECVDGQCQKPTFVSLYSFTATPSSNKVILNWSTASEIDNAGFNIYRGDTENGVYEQINAALIAAEGWATMGASYEFIDTDVENRKTYWYKIEDVDLSGGATMHGPENATPRFISGLMQ